MGTEFTNLKLVEHAWQLAADCLLEYNVKRCEAVDALESGSPPIIIHSITSKPRIQRVLLSG